ncbi:MAG: hypothetical protein K2O18_12705 [Oscillospiraceae bacterium]|nr:hypothetical protein [Oscillospiraceae bacterium]
MLLLGTRKTSCGRLEGKERSDAVSTRNVAPAECRAAWSASGRTDVPAMPDDRSGAQVATSAYALFLF